MRTEKPGQKRQQVALQGKNEAIIKKGTAEVAINTVKSSDIKIKNYSIPKGYYEYLALYIQLKKFEIPIKVKDFYNYVQSMRAAYAPAICIPSFSQFAKNIRTQSAVVIPNMEIPFQVLFQLSEKNYIPREALVNCLTKYGFIDNPENIKNGKLIPPMDGKGPLIEYETRKRKLGDQKAHLQTRRQTTSILQQSLSSTLSFHATPDKASQSELVNQQSTAASTTLSNSKKRGFSEDLSETLESTINKNRKLSHPDYQQDLIHDLGTIQDLLDQLTEKIQSMDEKNPKLEIQQRISIAEKEAITTNEMVPVWGSQVFPVFPGVNPSHEHRIINSGMPFIVIMTPRQNKSGNIIYDMVDKTKDILGDYNSVKVVQWWQLERFIKDYPLKNQKAIKAQIETQIREILNISQADERRAWYDKYMRVVNAEELGGNRGAGVLSKGIPAWTCFPYAGVLQNDEELQHEPPYIKGTGGPSAYAWKVHARFTLNGRWRSNPVSIINAWKLTNAPETFVGKQNMSAIGIAGKNKRIMHIVCVSLGEGIPEGIECLVDYGADYEVPNAEKIKTPSTKFDISTMNILTFSTRSTRNSMSALV